MIPTIINMINNVVELFYSAQYDARFLTQNYMEPFGDIISVQFSDMMNDKGYSLFP